MESQEVDDNSSPNQQCALSELSTSDIHKDDAL
jgi:hypothetical protein